MWLQIYPCSD